MPIYYIVIPCAVLALLIYPYTVHSRIYRMLWAFCVYLESVSVLPQLRLMQNAKMVEPFTAHYVFALGVARFLGCAHWIIKRGFKQQWLSLTFSKAIFLGNGLIAIISGLFGNLLVDNLNLGPVAPFDAAAVFLAIGMAVILLSWTENYGDTSENKDLLTQFRGAAIPIASSQSLTSVYVSLLDICSLYLMKTKFDEYLCSS